MTLLYQELKKIVKVPNILGIYVSMAHSDLKWQIRLGNYFWGYNAQIFHFCQPLDFLCAKALKKIIKGQRRSKRPNQRPDTGEF